MPRTTSHRIKTALRVGVLITLVAVPCGAKTKPRDGAAALPEGVGLRAPVPCGVKYFTYSSYGANMHRGRDYYALDVQRDEGAPYGRGKPITAVADGTVRYAAPGFIDPAYGNTVVIEHAFGDGKVYHSLYAHLEDIGVAIDQVVRAGDAVGTLGATGSGSGGSFHLHFALWRDGAIKGKTISGEIAVVPEPLGGTEDFVFNTRTVARCDDTASPPPRPSSPDEAQEATETTPERGASRGRRVPSADDSSGGCRTARGGAGLAEALAIVLGALLARRRALTARMQTRSAAATSSPERSSSIRRSTTARWTLHSSVTHARSRTISSACARSASTSGISAAGSRPASIGVWGSEQR